MRRKDAVLEIWGLVEPDNLLVIKTFCGRCGRGVSNRTLDVRESNPELVALLDQAALVSHWRGVCPDPSFEDP